MTSDEKFRKTEHILKTGEFQKVYKKRRSYAVQGSFVVYCLQNTLPNSRIGFSISSKRVRLATRRNRIRRLIREAYRHNKGRIKSGFDIVIVARRDPGERIGYLWAEDLLLKLVKGSGILV